jgi:UDP-glucose 4-epimerase
VILLGTCIVTGGAGFIGSNLVERLLTENRTVLAIDKNPKKQKNIAEFAKLKNFKFLLKDINDLKLSDIPNDIDMMYHLAASADIQKSFQNPNLDLKNNVLGTNAILELMRKKDIKNLVFSSSSAVYGIAKIMPTPEDMPDLRPISMYGASKLANEAFIHSYSDLYGMKAWVFRFANVVGKHEGRGVIYDFVKKLKKNPHELEILGDGHQVKSYFLVSDCVSGMVDLPRMDSNNSVEIYNLGNLETTKVTQVAEIVCDELNLKPKFRYTGGDRGWEGDVPVTILSIEKALKVGWKPRYNAEQSIRLTVRHLLEKQR